MSEQAIIYEAEAVDSVPASLLGDYAEVRGLATLEPSQLREEVDYLEKEAWLLRKAGHEAELLVNRAKRAAIEAALAMRKGG